MLYAFAYGFLRALGIIVLAVGLFALAGAALCGPAMLAVYHSGWWLLLYPLELCIFLGIDEARSSC